MRIESAAPGGSSNPENGQIEDDEVVAQLSEEDPISYRVHSPSPLRLRIRVEEFLPVVVETPAPTV